MSYPRRRKSSITAVTTQNLHEPGNMNDVHIFCKIMIMPELNPDLIATYNGSTETIIQRNIG